jgi:hypothetical protein
MDRTSDGRKMGPDEALPPGIARHDLPLAERVLRLEIENATQHARISALEERLVRALRLLDARVGGLHAEDEAFGAPLSPVPPRPCDEAVPVGPPTARQRLYDATPNDPAGRR